MKAERVVTIVSELTDIPDHLIPAGNVRYPDVCLARHLTAYALRYAGASSGRITDILGYATHTSVLRSVRKIEKLEKADPDIKRLIQKIKKRIREEEGK